MGNTCAGARLRTAVSEIILLVVDHQQHVCLCVCLSRWKRRPVRLSSCPPSPLYLPTWQSWTPQHPSFSHPDTSGMYLLPSFNYSEAGQLWPRIRATYSLSNAWQLGCKWQNWLVTLLIAQQLCDYPLSAMNRQKTCRRKERQEDR